MGFLRKLFGAGESAPPEQAPRPITDWSDRAHDDKYHRIAIFDPVRSLHVVGESAYQGTIERIAGGRTVDGAKNRDHVGALLPEPTNPYDKNAVRVVLSQQVARPISGLVGYLSRADAVAYRPVIDRMAAGGFIVACRASIDGGWDRGDTDRGNFGVRLVLNTPAGLMREIDVSEWANLVPPAPPLPEPPELADLPKSAEFSGKTVCFSGESTCRMNGQQLSREDQERFAARLGLIVHPSVTKKVDVLVVSSTRLRTRKVAKATEYGTRIMLERDFWRAVGLPVDE